jgi:hypothetical protein
MVTLAIPLLRFADSVKRAVVGIVPDHVSQTGEFNFRHRFTKPVLLSNTADPEAFFTWVC